MEFTTKKMTYLLYGIFALPLSWFGISLFVFLPKYYVENGFLSFSALSIVVILFRVVDAILDVVIGRFIETIKGGKRSLLGVIDLMMYPLAIAIILTFTPSLFPGSVPFVVFLLPLGILLLFSWTTVQISYESIVPNLVSDYGGRSVLLSYRAVGMLCGSLAASIAPVLLRPYVSEHVQWLIIAALIVAIFLVSSKLNLRKIRYDGEKRSKKKTKKILSRLGEVLSDKSIRSLFLAYGLTSVGSALPAALILFYVEHILRSSNGPAYVGLYLFVASISLPLWTWLGNTFDKKHLWIYGIFVNAGSFFIVYFLGSEQEHWYALLVSISAIGYGATLIFPSSMQADVIDYDQWKHSERKEAELSSVFLFTKKTFAAIGLGASFYLLGNGTFSVTYTFTEESKEALRVLYAFVPSVVSILSIFCLIGYEINSKKIESIQRDLRSEQ